MIVVPPVAIHRSDPEELCELLETRNTAGALRHNEPGHHLIAELAAAPFDTMLLSNKANGEASFSIYKPNNPT
jgi:hypothetical protein